MGRTIRVRAQLATAAWVIGALLSACGGDSQDGPAASGAAMVRPNYGFGPWGGRVSSTSSQSSSSGTSDGSFGPTSGTVTLSWDAPTQNTNGTTLSNLAGFYIHYGKQSGDYTNTIQIANPGTTRYVVDQLAPGTYYFVVTAYSAAGEDSANSSQVSVSVN